MILVTRILVCLYLLNAQWNQETSLCSHSFTPMHLCKTFCQVLFVLVFTVELKHVLFVQKQSLLSLLIKFNPLTDYQRNTTSFLFPSPKYLTYSPGSFINVVFFLLAMKTSEPASLRNCQSNNNLYIESSNTQRSICIYLFAVVKCRVFLTRSQM